MEAQENQPPLPFRAHTILGVCEGLGEDFGFNPVWLRVPFAASMLLSPTWGIGIYLALGLMVLASRLIFPRAKSQRPEAAVTEGSGGAPAEEAANEQRELAAAA